VWQEWLIDVLVLSGLVGFIALLIGVARAHRKAKRAIAEGKQPAFSWALFIFSIYILAQGLRLFIQECIYEKHKTSGTVANLMWQGAGMLLLAVGLTAFTNQLRWLVYIRRNRQ